jgi:hypothetical protein
MASRDDRVTALLQRHGTTFAEDLGLDLSDPSPSTLWRWYVACLLMSARISSDQAVRAARAWYDEIGRTPRATAAATWRRRVRVLNTNGYARYDERTSSMLGDTATVLLERYGGDLRRLRAEADGDPVRIHRLLQQFKGVGRVGADIFCREVQTAWDELFPFVDDAAAGIAEDLELGSSSRAIATLVPRDELPRLLAALVKASLADDLDAVRAGRRPSPGDPAIVLDRLTREELYALARQSDLTGRSAMRRAELRDALAAA